MIVGVLRETAARESRVALTPPDVYALTAGGVSVVVESGAGESAGFADAEYLAAGGIAAPDPARVFDRSDVIAWVKPPVYDLHSMPLRPGHLVVGFQDPVRRRDHIERLWAGGVESLAFELISDPLGRDPLSAMSRIAGAVAYREGRALARDQGDGPFTTVVVGCGQAGLAAVAESARHGDRTVAAGSRLVQGPHALERGAGGFQLAADQEAVADLLARVSPDLIVTAAGRGTLAPLLVGDEALARVHPGTVVVDLAGKAGGNCAATVCDKSYVSTNGVVVVHRSNFPAELPRVASKAFGSATVRVLLGLDEFRGAVVMNDCYSCASRSDKSSSIV
ncbi:hypothetical protein ACWIGI_09780 [Nocardia sp. NPDC055321]